MYTLFCCKPVNNPLSVSALTPEGQIHRRKFIFCLLNPLLEWKWIGKSKHLSFFVSKNHYGIMLSSKFFTVIPTWILALHDFRDVWINYSRLLGRGPYLSPGNCICILWQKIKCIRILGHKLIHKDSDQIPSILKKCIRIPIIMYSCSKVKAFSVHWCTDLFMCNTVHIKSYTLGATPSSHDFCLCVVL